MTHYHLIGIGGSGLSAIATVLLERGHDVSGSDREFSTLAQRVQAAGANVFLSHQADHVTGADLVIRSSAIPDDNVEVQAALASGIPVLKRVDFLRRIMESKKGVAIAGTHGKTTTTAMVAWILTALGQEPSYIIGGVSRDLDSNARAGHGPYFVIEADEYDRMFLGLSPAIAVVTNVEYDHPDCYPTPREFYQAFQDFVDCLEANGTLVACADDLGAASLLASTVDQGYRTRSYGVLTSEYDYWAQDLIHHQAGGSSFKLCSKEFKKAVPVLLQIPGKHNVLNAVAALVVADLLGLSVDEASQALGEFQGTSRRFDVRGEGAGVTIVDDYAHHPTEIQVTLAAARARYPGQRIWAVWQPHTYSRTRMLFDGFVEAFQDADYVLIMDVFAAREKTPTDGFSASQIVDAIGLLDHHPDAHFIRESDAVQGFMLERLQPGDVVIVLSAGDANQICTQLLDTLQKRALSGAGHG